MPTVTCEENENGKTVKMKYQDISDTFVLRTFNAQTRLREIPTGCLEDVPTPRISQPDPSFDNMMETFSGEFSWKHSDEGYYQNTLVHTLYVPSHTSHIEYAVISDCETEYKTPEEYEKIYLSSKNSAEKIKLNEAGKNTNFQTSFCVPLCSKILCIRFIITEISWCITPPVSVGTLSTLGIRVLSGLK